MGFFIDNASLKLGVVFTTVYFIRNLRMGSIGWSDFPWQAFPALFNVTPNLIRLILQKVILHYSHNFCIGPTSRSVFPRQAIPA
jgi:hypothetical protein